MNRTLQNTIARFVSGGKVLSKKTFLGGYSFKNYDDMIQSLEDAKNDRYDLGDAVDSSENFKKAIKDAIEFAGKIREKYIYKASKYPDDTYLAINIDIEPVYNLKSIIEKISNKYNLSKKNKDFFNDKWAEEITKEYINDEKDSSELALFDFIRLGICKDEIYFVDKNYLIFRESNFFERTLIDLNYALRTDFDYYSFDNWLQSKAPEIREHIRDIHYYNFAFGVLEAYVKKMWAGIERYVEQNIYDAIIHDIGKGTGNKAHRNLIQPRIGESYKYEKSGGTYKFGSGGITTVIDKRYGKVRESEPEPIWRKDERYIKQNNKNEILKEWAILGEDKFALAGLKSLHKDLIPNDIKTLRRENLFGDKFQSSYEYLRLSINPDLSTEQKRKWIEIKDIINKKEQGKWGLKGANGDVWSAESAKAFYAGWDYEKQWDDVDDLDYDDIQDLTEENIIFLNAELKKHFNKAYYFTYSVSSEMEMRIKFKDHIEYHNKDKKQKQKDYDYVLVLKNEEDFDNAIEHFGKQPYATRKNGYMVFFESDNILQTKEYVERELEKIKIANYGFMDTERIYKHGGKVDSIKRGKSDNMSEFDLAKKHGVSVDVINRQIQKGIMFEKEHTDNPVIQREIAKDHIEEIVDYYDRLENMEKQANTKRVISPYKNLSDSQFNSINNYMKNKGFSPNDYELNRSGNTLIYKDINDKTFKEVSLFIKNLVI